MRTLSAGGTAGSSAPGGAPAGLRRFRGQVRQKERDVGVSSDVAQVREFGFHFGTSLDIPMYGLRAECLSPDGTLTVPVFRPASISPDRKSRPGRAGRMAETGACAR